MNYWQLAFSNNFHVQCIISTKGRGVQTVSLISEDPAVQLTQSTVFVVVNDSSSKLIQAVVLCLVKG